MNEQEEIFHFIYKMAKIAFIDIDVDDIEFYNVMQRLLLNTSISQTNMLEYGLKLLKENSFSENIDLNNPEEIYELWIDLMEELLAKNQKFILNNCFQKENENLEKCFFLSKNFAQVKNLMFAKKENSQEDHYFYLTIPKETSISLALEFIRNIDPSGTWLKIIENGLKNKTIVCWENTEMIPEEVINQVTIENRYNFSVKEDYPIFLNAPFSNTISDSIALVHEMIHYIIFSQKYPNQEEKDALTIFSETPSYFYETLFALELSQKKEYRKDVIHFLKIRKKDLSSSNLYNKIFEGIAAIRNKQKLPRIYQKNELILTIMNEDFQLFSQYVYVVARFITEKLLEKRILDKTIDIKMRNVTNSLGYTSMDPLYIIKYLGLEKEFEDFKSVNTITIPKIEDFKRKRTKTN